MAIRPNEAVFRQIRTLFNVGVIGDLTDAQLLERFTTLDREAAELAFAALVERHGPMVLRVCRNLLNNPHDAEDAFQATFLVLVKKARALWVGNSLAPWLHRVAHRVASRARASTLRRREQERRAAELKPTQVHDEDKSECLLRLLHKEIDRLPDQYRVVIVLCDMEGLSHERAARHLGWPVGTVKSRLARARQLLRSRLSGRGIALPTIFVITKAATCSVDAVVSPRMVDSTLRAALFMAKAPTLGVISVSVAHLVEEVLGTMFLTKLKLISAAALMCCALTAGTATVLGRQGVGLDSGSASDQLGPKTADIARPAPEDVPTRAPAFIRQSRGMIVTRLEQELAVAKTRLERTLRRVVSPNDPAAVQGRKTVDEIEGLLARIDGVLVNAVDRFPTMFDFSGGQGDPGSASASPNSGTLLDINVNDVYQSSFRKPGDSQLITPNIQAVPENAKPSGDTSEDWQNGQGNQPSAAKPEDPQKNNENGSQPSGSNKGAPNGQGNDPSFGKPGDPQKNGQAANEKGSQSSGADNGAQKGQGNDPSFGKPGDPQKNGQAANEKGSQSSGADKGAQKGQGNDPSFGKPGDGQKNGQAGNEKGSQSSGADKGAQKGQGNDPSFGKPGDQKPYQNQQQSPNQSQQQSPNQKQKQPQQPNLQIQAPPAGNQPNQQKSPQNNQQNQQQQPPDGKWSNTRHAQTFNAGSMGKNASSQPSPSQQSRSPRSQFSQSQVQKSQSKQPSSQQSQGSGSQSSDSKASSSQGSNGGGQKARNSE